MMPEPLYKDELDHLPCFNPDCDHTSHTKPMALNAYCHPTKPVRVWYKDGLLTLNCAICKQIVVQIAVARREDVACRMDRNASEN